MPVKISWAIPSRVIRAHCYGDITAEDLSVFPDEARFYIMSGKTPVHMLLDDSAANPLIFSIRQMHDILKFRMEDRDRIGWIVGVGQTNMLATVMIPILLKTMGLRFKRVANLADAMAFLVQHDNSLAADIALSEEQV